ncbi:MAG: 3'-5' exonuclease, partial [Chloroflexi bacterium]|nr:3'-5' exonuclease [Chloroflexota bacterium]
MSAAQLSPAMFEVEPLLRSDQSRNRSLMRRTYVALDIETTGLDPDRDSIIEIGAVRFRVDSASPSSRPAQSTDTWSTLINPGRPLPYKIQMLTGIKPQDVRRAPPLAAVIPALAAF